MVYSVPPKDTKSAQAQRPTAHLTETKAIVSLDDRRYVLDGPVAVLGRSRECDCVSTTRTSPGATPSCAAGPPATGRSSTWARPTASRSTGDRWTRRASRPGDEVTLGTVRFAFDIEQ